MPYIMHNASQKASAICTIYSPNAFFMEDASSRLRSAREKAGYETAKAAAEAMGIPVATYIQHENGVRGFPANKAERYARFFRTSPEWLLYGKGDSEVRTVFESQRIPIWGKVAAGVWLEETYIEPDLVDMPKVNYDRLPGQRGSQDLFAVEIAGDSMNLAFPGNSILICERVPFGLAEIKAGDFVIVERENHNLREMTCKEILVENDGTYLLQSRSTNPKYAAPIRIPRSVDDEYIDNGVTIIGKVVRAIQDFSRN
jgi:SOS-response transcriptional repressor LexA